MKQCTCYALRAIDCTCKPAKYGELYTTPTAKQEQGEPLEYWNAVEGWVKLDEVREHFDSVSCATIYKNGGEGRMPLSLAQPKQEQGEPVAWMDIDEKGAASGLRYWPEPDNRHEVALYTTPQQRPSRSDIKPLTDEQIDVLADKFTVKMGEMFEPELCIEFNDSCKSVHGFTRAIEAAHGIKE